MGMRALAMKSWVRYPGFLDEFAHGFGIWKTPVVNFCLPLSLDSLHYARSPSHLRVVHIFVLDCFNLMFPNNVRCSGIGFISLFHNFAGITATVGM